MAEDCTLRGELAGSKACASDAVHDHVGCNWELQLKWCYCIAYLNQVGRTHAQTHPHMAHSAPHPSRSHHASSVRKQSGLLCFGKGLIALDGIVESRSRMWSA